MELHRRELSCFVLLSWAEVNPTALNWAELSWVLTRLPTPSISMWVHQRLCWHPVCSSLSPLLLFHLVQILLRLLFCFPSFPPRAVFFSHPLLSPYFLPLLSQQNRLPIHCRLSEVVGHMGNTAWKSKCVIVPLLEPLSPCSKLQTYPVVPRALITARKSLPLNQSCSLPCWMCSAWQSWRGERQKLILYMPPFLILISASHKLSPLCVLDHMKLGHYVALLGYIHSQAATVFYDFTLGCLTLKSEPVLRLHWLQTLSGSRNNAIKADKCWHFEYGAKVF